MPKIVPKSLQTCFEHVLGQTFRKILAQFSMECRVFENFQKKYFRNSKNAQKCSQKYPNVFYGDFFEKNLCPVFHGMSSIRKFSKKKYFRNSKNAQKCSQKYPNVFYGDFFEKNLCPVFHGMSSIRKFSKKNIFGIPKMPKSVPKSIQTCFERVMGQTFRKIIAQFSTAGRILENFQKNQKKIQNSKNAQNRSQKNPNVF